MRVYYLHKIILITCHFERTQSITTLHTLQGYLGWYYIKIFIMVILHLNHVSLSVSVLLLFLFFCIYCD